MGTETEGTKVLESAKQKLESGLQSKSDRVLTVILVTIGLVVIGIGFLPNHRILKIIVILYTLLP
jgi:hypothetical protein